MRQRTPTQPRGGFTLIEVIMVIAIIAVVVSGASFGVGALTRTRLRSASFRVMSAAQYAYSRSVTHGTTTRLQFDFEKNTMAVEETEAPVTIANHEQLESDTGGAVDPWELARLRIEKPLDREPPPISEFSPITTLEGEPIKRYQPQPIGDGIAIHALVTPRDSQPRTEGEGGVYFFPGGVTEHTVVQLKDGSDTVYSVEIHPLTGNARIYPYAYEPLSDLDDEGEVRDSL
ncbi:MAG: prepilin-type N-terminal cleavage/methylation domain-containing protein [Myxococcales bacterium]|nr:prepilin-type N-terminal cleavage/methylation domain-containing protein [Myxococcales bacterium]MDH3485508.1 prepilin-type N-terminal cleavage/methylation domain-containing protein [Myxococcales bacterium]